MANDISYAQKYSPELDKMIVQGAKTGFFADNVFKAKFVGAKTVQIPEISLGGLGDYDRAEGYSKGDVNLTFKEYTLSKDRSKQMTIDAQDADESGVPDLVGKLVGEYTRTIVNPEIDAYVLSKLAGIALSTADGKANNTKTYAKDSAVADLLAAINNAEAANGYNNDELVAFVDPVMYAAIMTSAELQRSITVSEFKQGEVNMQVKKLNGCAIIPVSAERMHTVFTFSENGFAPADGSKTIKAVVLPKGSASLVKKVDKVNVLSPNEVEDMDAYKINYRLYYDLFVTNSRLNTVHAIIG
jgi:hypothetical protein